MSNFPTDIHPPKACPNCGHREFERGYVYSSHGVGFHLEKRTFFESLKRAFSSRDQLYGYVCQRCRRVELFHPG